jgi:hypothetical protein
LDFDPMVILRVISILRGQKEDNGMMCDITLFKVRPKTSTCAILLHYLFEKKRMRAQNFHFTPAFSQLGRRRCTNFCKEIVFHGGGKMERNIRNILPKAWKRGHEQNNIL